MMIKYRVHELAKDFDLNTKDVLEMLAKYVDSPKKSMTALEENELNIVFDLITQKNSVESFDAYFAAGEEAAAKRAEQKAAKAAEQAALAEMLRAQQAAAKAPADKGSKSPAAATAAAAKPGTQAKKPSGGVSVPIPPAPKKPAGETPNRGPAEIRMVDTRAATVELDKYNEKYDRIASARISGNNNMSQGKQKIKQKSQDYRRPRGVKRETEADKLRRIQLERIKKTPITVTVGEEITVAELADRMKKTAAELIKQLMKLGVMVSANETIDFDTAEIVVTEMGAKIERAVVVTIEERIMDIAEDTEEDLVTRDPVVVVMGHVDHGKTSLLDAMRNANVTAGEAGGITQHIGAYKVKAGEKEITFLDTPGHEAFTAMRQRGAQVTDIAVLVVAADDGIKPQTIEAIAHAKAAGVQVLVAINKIDSDGANIDKVMQQLTEYELIPEEWGGDIMCVPVSAKTHENIDKLLDGILLTAEMMELKANPSRRAKGTVIEARLDKGRGPVATLLVQNGTLRVGDIIVAGTAVGRVRAMTNEHGTELSEAGPSVPVEITGLADVPSAGDGVDGVSDERLARELVEQRKHSARTEQWDAVEKVTLDNLFSQIEQGQMKDLNIIVKADVRGTAEAVKQSLEKLSNEEVRVRVIHVGVGAISESDVMLASTGGAIIVGFNVRPDPVAASSAERDGVDMRMYRIIYDCIEEIESAMKGMLAPKFREVIQGRIEVRQTYKISSVGTIAGCYVLDGKVTRHSEIRVVRDGIVVSEDKIDSLRRFKDDVKEVASGYECGIGLIKFNDVKDGDIYEAFIMEEYRD